MSIKPDHWIRKMSLEHGMIDPFVEKQVRSGVISFGVSSYGYDIRVADEFKIFTNVNSAIVDPKHFDPASFVDFKGDICIVPPNSFALARTVERFKIPRSVMAVCVGKSTYARCFRGDTRVALVDGTAPTLEEMARRADNGEMFWGYSLNKQGKSIVTKLQAPRFIGKDCLLEIILNNSKPVYSTPDHKFILQNGHSLMANQLRRGYALMPRQLSQPHTVTGIREIAGDHDVYCLTVPEAGNFALEAGVFVHNCGIILNVTPAEPEWEGYLTLEISNTTPLPARIYAGEGIAQLLFFESDEPCETSYADRQGKYQDQVNITLPRI